MGTETNRREDFDFIKGCLILFVIWGHFCMYLSGDGYEKNLLTTYVRLFQMPLFIFISGYFQKPVNSLSLASKKLQKSVKHIGIPMLSWIALVYCAKLVINGGQYNGLTFFIEQAKGIVSLFWYLGCLLMCLFLFTIISCCYHKNRHFGSILFILSLFISLMFKGLSIFHFSFLWLFFCLGIVYKKYEDVIRHSILFNHSTKIVILIALISSVLVLGGGYDTSWTFYNTDNCVFTHDSPWKSEAAFILYRYFVYIISTITAFILIRMFYYKVGLSKFIIAIGRETLFLYVAHVVILAMFARPILELLINQECLLPNYPIVRYYIICPICTIIIAASLYHLALFTKKHLPQLGKLFIGS